MSVYRPKRKDGTDKSPYFHFDFTIKVDGRSRRFSGSTGQTSRSAALKVEARNRQLAATGHLQSTLSIGDACDRYWREVASHAPSEGAKTQAKHTLSELVYFYGAATLLTEVTPSAVTIAMSKRAETPVMVRAPGGGTRPSAKFPKPATINRQVVEPMRRVLRRAKKHWGIPLDLEQFDWGGRDGLKMPEDSERIRVLSAEEELRFWPALNEDLHPITELYIISGKRQSIWLGLKKFDIDASSKSVRVPVLKQGVRKFENLELTEREFEIIAEETTKSPCEFVFTAHFRGTGDRKRMSRTVLYKGLAAAFDAAEIRDFRPHDLRHTFASRAMAAGASLKSLQVAMNHNDIKSTMRYAHLTDEARAVRETRSRVTVQKTLPPNVVLLRKSSS